MSRLIYFADPMCSWCYGFGPQLSELLARDNAYQVLLVMGGLRPYNTKRADDTFKDMLRGHWAHVRELSGMPITETILERDDFVYDTEPASRAVVTVRAHDQARSLDYFHDLQRAFYRDGRDVTQSDVLADMAAPYGMEREAFLQMWQSEEARKATRVDFETAQKLGVTGFPTVAYENEGGLHAVAAGYSTTEQMCERIARIEAGAAPT